ncbi:AfsR/SARP family transcriptional regulator [Nocardiopsis aegyptia]|uniref:DNA-binding SARP family transcriptional activator n=1 Tax=Nocardiopsis aegyptia TaxID=220378 RepID=A0A7Z0EQ78_9ACTN|nr:AfsR/SARP family transcriptional regulator [Nocardiopsis aegyptia]NYJ35892.1 DNA-binding SARP family transcriptional activator [Nocardiopsis aegyptia]
MGLLLGLLGPVRLLDDPDDPSPGPPKLRTLLAALALQPNQVVPLERLMAALWEEHPPRSAVANLRTYANLLRRRLPPAACSADRARLVASSPGYMLRVCPHELDSLAFAELHRRGRRALADGDPRSAVPALVRALELWRGAAAEDVPRGPELGARLDALDEQRRSAAEDLAHARLDLGADVELVADLRALAAEDPVRERVWHDLMLALYRTGETSAALDAYHAARRSLSLHLGVEPGPELVQLHAAILHRDPALDDHAPGRAAEHPACHAVPAPPTPFVGRRTALDALERALVPGEHAPVAAVDGPVGSGKSALALKAAARVAGRFPDGCLYIDLGDAAGSDRTELHETWRRARSGGARILIVLDNAADEAQARPLVATWPGAATLVTGRRRCVTLGGAVHVGLDPLTRDQAVDLLAALCGAERVAAQRSDAVRVAELCDRQPLALWLAGTRMATRREWPLPAFARLLADPRHRLDVLSCGDRSLRAALDSAYLPLCDSADAGDRRAAALFRLLGRSDLREIGPAGAAALLETDVNTAIAALGRLAEARLLEPTGELRYTVPGLLRVYAAEAAPRVPAPRPADRRSPAVLTL